MDQDARADAMLVAIVRKAGRSSPFYRQLQDALEESGLGLLTRIGPYRIFGELDKLGIRVPRTSSRGFVDEFPALSWMAVRKATDRFMDRQVLQGGWDAQRGASLRSFLARAVLYAFGEQYRQYYREETSREAYLDDPGTHADQVQAPASEEPEAVLVNRDLIRRIVPTNSEMALRIAVLTAEGFSHAEIGAMLDVSPSVVSTLLRRLRRRVRKMSQEGRTDRHHR